MANMIFKSEVVWTRSGVASDAISGKHTLRIDEPEVLGGQDTGPNPVELLLSGLGGCLVVLVNAFAPVHGVEICDVKVNVEGDLDPDGFLGKSNVRPGFSEIRYQLKIDSPSDKEKILALQEHVLKVCPVKDTLTGVSVVPIK